MTTSGRPTLRTPPTPLRVDARRVVAVGTALWFAVAVGLAPFWAWLGRTDHRIWLWTSLTGGVLGLLGLLLMSRHRDEGRFE